MNSQDDLFAATIAQRFAAWKATPGGRHLLAHAYRITAGLLKETRPGQPLSVKLVWELLRHRYRGICLGLRKRGITPASVDGFALNNIFTAHVARHLVAHRPEWAECFELRELNVRRKKRKVVVIEEEIAA